MAVIAAKVGFVKAPRTLVAGGDAGRPPGYEAATRGKWRMTSLIEKRISVNGLKLNYAEGPDSGPPVIFLHGASGWWRSWLPTLATVCPSYRVFAPDMRGAGLSERAETYQVMDMARDVVGFIEQALRGEAILVGHSFGGHVALAAQALLPKRVVGLVLEDIPLMVDHGRLAPRPAGENFSQMLAIVDAGTRFEQVLAKVKADMPQGNPRLDRQRARSLSRYAPESLRQYVAGQVFDGYDPEALSASLAAPTLMMCADPEVWARIDEPAAARAASLSPHLETMVVKGAGHSIHTDDPVGYTNTLLAWLNGFFG